MNRLKYNDIPNSTEFYVKFMREVEAMKVDEEFKKIQKELKKSSEEKKRELIRLGLLKDE